MQIDKLCYYPFNFIDFLTNGKFYKSCYVILKINKIKSTLINSTKLKYINKRGQFLFTTIFFFPQQLFLLQDCSLMKLFFYSKRN